MLALIGALGEEISGIRRQMTIAEVIARPDFKLYRGKYSNQDCLLVQTGMGKQRVETAARFTLEHFPVTTIISFGFAGALTPELRVGDIIICSTLYYCNGRSHPGLKSASLSSNGNLLELATRVLGSGRVRYSCGSSISVPQPLSDPESKEKLYKIAQAHIADMESYWIAKIASEERIPFLAIRAVTDARQGNLPPFEQMLAGDGSWLRGKALSYFVLHPKDLSKLPGLYWNSRKARRSLSDCVAQVVANIN
ncbi:MAG: hypothetical protein ACE5KP_01040 [Dehalococcoidales bacterium]